MRDTELQINLSNLSHNLNILKEKTSSEIQGVLKAFSYGLEIREVVEVTVSYTHLRAHETV